MPFSQPRAAVKGLNKCARLFIIFFSLSLDAIGVIYLYTWWGWIYAAEISFRDSPTPLWRPSRHHKAAATLRHTMPESPTPCRRRASTPADDFPRHLLCFEGAFDCVPSHLCMWPHFTQMLFLPADVNNDVLLFIGRGLSVWSTHWSLRFNWFKVILHFFCKSKYSIVVNRA